MSQKNVYNIVQCNTVSFSKNAHETGVQRYRTTSQTVRIPFLFVSFRTVPRSRNAAFFVEERQPRWSACRFPATFFTLLAASWLRRKPREAFLESGRSPSRAMAGPPDDLRSIVKARA